MINVKMMLLSHSTIKKGENIKNQLPKLMKAKKFLLVQKRIQLHAILSRETTTLAIAFFDKQIAIHIH